MTTQVLFSAGPKEILVKIVRDAPVSSDTLGNGVVAERHDVHVSVPLSMVLGLEGGSAATYHLVSFGVHTLLPKHWVAARGDGDGVAPAREWFRANDSAVDRVDVARYLDSVAGSVSVLWYVREEESGSSDDDVDVR